MFNADWLRQADQALVFAADFHFDRWPRLPQLYDDTVKVFEKTVDICQELRAPLFLLGDTLNPEGGKISADLLDPTFRLIETSQQRLPLPTYISAGNHARGARGTTDHLETPFGGLNDVWFIDGPQELDLHLPQVPHLKVFAVPYQANQEVFFEAVLGFHESALNNRGGVNILTTHQGYRGGWVGPDEPGYQPNDASFWQVPPGLFAPFTIVFSGHFHKHQQLSLGGGTVVYCGAPMQHNFGDRGQERGIIVCALTQGQFQWAHMPLKLTPTFHKIEVDKSNLKTVLSTDWSSSYVWPVIKDKEVTTKNLEKLGALFQAPPLFKTEEEVVVRLETKEDAPPECIFSDWLDLEHPELSPEERQEVLNEGFTLINETKKGVTV